jgi:hypothetical protein
LDGRVREDKGGGGMVVVEGGGRGRVLVEEEGGDGVFGDGGGRGGGGYFAGRGYNINRHKGLNFFGVLGRINWVRVNRLGSGIPWAGWRDSRSRGGPSGLYSGGLGLSLRFRFLRGFLRDYFKSIIIIIIKKGSDFIRIHHGHRLLVTQGAEFVH